MEARSDKKAEDVSLPPIPAKRYFTIGEVSKLCDVETYVIRYWEGHFSQLKPVKRRGNRRYYQHHEIVLIRRIRELLRVEGFTLNGAVRRLDELTGKQMAAHASKSLREEIKSVIEMLSV
ncbi:MAG: MerR family transcriptional regulator [Candidatus Accumulibacter sp.]|jgi:DNA-binding transcriptional MerR regulator|nr:MerR family transcriptional regulator [Accumulibacter sp.]